MKDTHTANGTETVLAPCAGIYKESTMYYVDYFVSFGEIAHETFTSRISMRLFMRQLAPNTLIAWGAVRS